MGLRNKLLLKLSREELEAVGPDLEPVELSSKKVLREPFEPITHVYFVERGVASLVNEPDNGDIVEVATVGPEGMVGFPVLLGPTPSQVEPSYRFPGWTACEDC